VIDRVELTLKGGDGGNGIVSFRREKFVPRGGPDGGDGGLGGSVILVADHSVRTLAELGRRRIYKADRGAHGQGSDKAGRGAEDLVLTVPVGTQVTAIEPNGDERLLADLQAEGQSFVAARGGIGGWGNARFATAVHQAPRIAQRGQQGEEVRVRLDLKLLADVGIVGLPNAGKSTLLTALSAARPRIGAYPFTTLEPHLGVVDAGWERFVAADIPGLIEGAHEGAGLGLDFLRHIERTRLIVHLLDGSEEDPLAALETVNRELQEYGHDLAGRPQVVVVNKLDIPEVAERRTEIARRLEERGIEPLFISAAGGEGVEELSRYLATRLGELDEGAAQPAETATDLPAPAARMSGRPGAVTVHREDGAYRVEGDRAVAFAEMMPLDSQEGRAELWRRFDKWGIAGALRRAGARRGDRIRLGRIETEMGE
jgi:GTP-binding protein